MLPHALTNYMKFETGKDAKAVRNKLGLTQEEFAETIGMQREAMVRVEKQAKLTNFQKVAYKALATFGIKWLSEK